MAHYLLIPCLLLALSFLVLFPSLDFADSWERDCLLCMCHTLTVPLTVSCSPTPTTAFLNSLHCLFLSPWIYHDLIFYIIYLHVMFISILVSDILSYGYVTLLPLQVMLHSQIFKLAHCLIFLWSKNKYTRHRSEREKEYKLR